MADIRQTEDYALDLHDFHLESRNRILIPILLAPKAKSAPVEINYVSDYNIHRCLKANSTNLSEIIYATYLKLHNSSSSKINLRDWEKSEYKPTPTIVQAARVLFAGKKVESISKSDADTINLTKTTQYLITKIKEAKDHNKKIVCFVTGVPGAGKTLVGLNIIHEKEVYGGQEFDTSYFSGNVPLIKVLTEALARDHWKRQLDSYKLTKTGKRPTKEDSVREIKAKIHNLHTFIKDGIRKETPPAERIVVFDEAQRCWDATHFYNQSKRNQNRETKPFALQQKSEAELLFEFMNRHDGWAVIIALVGGGQEINTGEAGISEWGRALKNKYSNWEVHISPKLLLGDSVTAGKTLFEKTPGKIRVHENSSLHLEVSQRSFRSNNLNAWVNAVIDNDFSLANKLSGEIQKNYPLLITRDLKKAKTWLRNKISGTKRVGLLASSGGLRLRPFGLFVKEEINVPYWFLNDEEDVRSSYYLEIAATEFAVQGLELDWIGLCWDGDLRRDNNQWDFKSFSGTSWHRAGVDSPVDRQYILNKYRVLLTRAREGLIVFIPEGDSQDQTRSPEIYNPIYDYLKSCGLLEI